MSVLNLPHSHIIIHVPKTAGTSMESKEFILGGGHQPLTFFERFCNLSAIGLDFNQLFKFAFVRNPYNRFASAATAHFMGHGQQAQFNRRDYPLTQAGFSEFIFDYLPEFQEMNDWNNKHLHFIPQHLFLQREDGELGMDFIGRFERLNKDWMHVCQKLQQRKDIGLSHRRKNGNIDYDSLYTPNTRRIVHAIYRRDFECFEYSA